MQFATALVRAQQVTDVMDYMERDSQQKEFNSLKEKMEKFIS